MMRSPLQASRTRQGLTAPEVLVVLLIVGLFIMGVLMFLPRRRETARTAGCQYNLAQIGVALALYHKAEGQYPTVPSLVDPPAETGAPLHALLATLNVPDFRRLEPPDRPRKKDAPKFNGVGRIPTLLCPTDVRAMALKDFPAPVSYRATTGDDVNGTNGGFAIGRRVSNVELEDGDGAAYTAAFSERLVGNDQAVDPTHAAYRLASSVSADGCTGDASSPPTSDAGRSWAEPSWRSTLYNHAPPPMSAESCIATDWKSAYLGASSAHVGGVNVLMFDGSVRMVSPTIALKVWQALATTHSPEAPTNTPEP